MKLLPPESLTAIARAFVDARREARSLPGYPGPLPRDMREAYAIQDEALRLAGQAIGGWKLGRINPPYDARFKANRLAGPIFAGAIVRDETGAAMPVIAGGFGAAEAEFLLQLGEDPDPSRAEWTLEDAKALAGAVHIGIEIASSPFPGINDFGPCVTASDFGNNLGLLVGPPLAGGTARDPDDVTVTLSINGEVAGRATTAAMLDGPYGALRFLLELMQRRGIRLRRGQWISTGAVTGVHPVRPGDRVEARFDDQTIGCRIVAAAPEQARERENVGSASGGG